MKITLEFEKASDFAVFVPLLTAVETGGLLNNPDLIAALDSVRLRLAGALVNYEGDKTVQAAPVEVEPEKKKRAPRGSASNTPEAKAAAESAEIEKVTLADVQKALKTLPDARPKAVAALKKFGREKISDLKEEELSAFMVELRAAGV